MNKQLAWALCVLNFCLTILAFGFTLGPKHSNFAVMCQAAALPMILVVLSIPVLETAIYFGTNILI